MRGIAEAAAAAAAVVPVRLKWKQYRSRTSENPKDTVLSFATEQYCLSNLGFALLCLASPLALVLCVTPAPNLSDQQNQLRHYDARSLSR